MPLTEPGSHVDQMIRQTRADHMQLSSLADVKANMLVTVAGVVLTLSAPQVFDPKLRWAALCFSCFCVVTIVLAAYAAMPKASTRGLRRHLPDERENLLFFGDFQHMTYDEYERAMSDVMSRPEHTYEMQIREIYSLGIYLGRIKFRLVRYAYIAFITGVVTSLVVLVVAVVT